MFLCQLFVFMPFCLYFHRCRRRRCDRSPIHQCLYVGLHSQNLLERCPLSGDGCRYSTRTLGSIKCRKQMEIVKRKEKTESHLYMTVRILYEDHFYGHQGNDLYETDKVTYQEIRVKKQDPLR